MVDNSLIVKIFDGIMKSENLTFDAFCKRLCISKRTIYRVRKGEASLSVKLFYQILRTFGNGHAKALHEAMFYSRGIKVFPKKKEDLWLILYFADALNKNDFSRLLREFGDLGLLNDYKPKMFDKILVDYLQGIIKEKPSQSPCSIARKLLAEKVLCFLCVYD